MNSLSGSLRGTRYSSIDEWPEHACGTCEKTFRHPARTPRTECSDCESDREQREAEEAHQHRLEEEARRERDRIADLRANLATHQAHAGVPAGYRRYTRGAWETLYGAWEGRESTRKLIDWPAADLDPLDWLVVFYGPYGRRKTSMATSILGEAICRDMSCVWWDMNDYLEKLKLGIRREKAESAIAKGTLSYMPRELENVQPYTLIKRWAWESDLLLLDDLGSLKGARPSSDAWWREEIAGLLRHRHAWLRATIVTTNGQIEDLHIIDASLVSRMDVRLAFDMDDGTDYRRADAHKPTPNQRNADRR